MKKRIFDIGAVANKVCRHACATTVGICMVVTLADVLSRQLTGKSLMWAQDVAVWSMLILCFLGAGMFVKEAVHINIDFLYIKLKGRALKIIDIINQIATLAFAIVLLIVGFQYMMYLYEFGVTRLFGEFVVPFWPIVAVSTVLGSLVLLIYSAIKLITTFS